MSIGAVPFIGPIPGSWLTQQHPLYPKRAKWWKYAQISYKGGRDYYEPDAFSVEFDIPQIIRKEDGTPAANQWSGGLMTQLYNSMLFRHSREQLHEYNNRNRRATYLNIVKQIVNSIISNALKKPPSRNADAKLKEFWDGVDEKRTTSIDAFMRKIAKRATTSGIWWICMDVDSEDGDGKPYVYGVNPLDIVDWSTDDDGEIEWLKQYVMTEEQRTYQQPFKRVNQYRVWTKTEVIEYQDLGSGNPKELSRRPIKVGRVPFVPMYAEKSDDYSFPDGISFVGDLAKIANGLYNVSSLLDEILYKQTFSWLVVPDPNQKLDATQIGLNTAFGFDPGGTGGKPEYISPDADQARVLIEARSELLQQARQSVGVGRGRQEGSMQKSSVDALELETEDKRSILADVAHETEAAERRIVALFRAYQGVADDKAMDGVYLAYPREFDVNSFEDEINDCLSLEKLGLSPEVRTEYLKDLVRRRFSNKPPADLDKLVATMDTHMAQQAEMAAAMQQAAVDTAQGNTPRTPNGTNGPPQGVNAGAKQ